jgi:hypothetical protein
VVIKCVYKRWIEVDELGWSRLRGGLVYSIWVDSVGKA